MELYAIRAWVNEHKRSGHIVTQYNAFVVVVDNLETAKSMFRKQKAEVESWLYNSKYSGKAELYVPHIHADGTLAYWSDGPLVVE